MIPCRPRGRIVAPAAMPRGPLCPIAMNQTRSCRGTVRPKCLPVSCLGPGQPAAGPAVRAASSGRLPAAVRILGRALRPPPALMLRRPFPSSPRGARIRLPARPLGPPCRSRRYTSPPWGGFHPRRRGPLGLAAEHPLEGAAPPLDPGPHRAPRSHPPPSPAGPLFPGRRAPEHLLRPGAIPSMPPGCSQAALCRPPAPRAAAAAGPARLAHQEVQPQGDGDDPAVGKPHLFVRHDQPYPCPKPFGEPGYPAEARLFCPLPVP